MSWDHFLPEVARLLLGAFALWFGRWLRAFDVGPLQHLLHFGVAAFVWGVLASAVTPENEDPTWLVAGCVVIGLGWLVKSKSLNTPA
jgi:hypothetical protein